jgi:hypothetical protein
MDKDYDVGGWLRGRSFEHPVLLILGMTIAGAVFGAGGIYLHAAVPPSGTQIIVFAVIGALALGIGSVYGLARHSR